jgi:hypothetical protein
LLLLSLVVFLNLLGREFPFVQGLSSPILFSDRFILVNAVAFCDEHRFPPCMTCGNFPLKGKKRSALLTNIAAEYNLKIRLTVLETMCTDVWAVAEFK